MNRKPVLQQIIFGSIAIINISSIISGVRRNENWLIIAGSVGLALILFAGVVNFRHRRAVR